MKEQQAKLYLRHLYKNISSSLYSNSIHSANDQFVMWIRFLPNNLSYCCKNCTSFWLSFWQISVLLLLQHAIVSSIFVMILWLVKTKQMCINSTVHEGYAELSQTNLIALKVTVNALVKQFLGRKMLQIYI